MSPIVAHKHPTPNPLPRVNMFIKLGVTGKLPNTPPTCTKPQQPNIYYGNFAIPFKMLTPKGSKLYL